MPREVDPNLLAKLAESNLRDSMGVRSADDIDALVDLGRITKKEAQTLKVLNQKGILQALTKGDTVRRGVKAAKDAERIDVSRAAFKVANIEEGTKDVARQVGRNLDEADRVSRAAKSVKGIEDRTKATAKAFSRVPGLGRVTAATEAELEAAGDVAMQGSTRRAAASVARGPNAIARALGGAGEAAAEAPKGIVGEVAAALPKASKMTKLLRFGGTALGAIAVADLIYQLLSSGRDENIEQRAADRFEQNSGSEFEAEHAYEQEINRFLNQRDTSARRANDMGESTAIRREGDLRQLVQGREEALAQIAYQEPPSLAEVIMRAGVRL